MGDSSRQRGVIFAAMAFISWGLLPVYWKALAAVPAPELLAHRIFWSLILVIIAITIRRGWGDIYKIVQSRPSIFYLLATSVLIAINWFVFIWAVTNGFILESSLGYFINPIFNILLGYVFLGERLRRFQIPAVVLALVGVLNLTISAGRFPWIALSLAGSFGVYGLLRKKVAAGALTGLAFETAILSIPSAGYLIFCEINGVAALGHINFVTDILLIGAGIVTALPLLWFAYGVKRLTLATVGFIQYLGPTGMFLLSVFVYKETFTATHLLTFILIWSGLMLYSIESFKNSQTNKANAAMLSRPTYR
ncbi:MAG: EamA family transporter RarD [Candidatus Neomarinimicrobiota bacterium]